MNVFIAADVGGTNLRLAVVRENGEILDQLRQRCDFSRQPSLSTQALETRILEALATPCRTMMGKHPDIAAIGIGFPGFFRGDSGVLAASPNLPQLADFALAARLQDMLELPVAAQNDALCAALGEYRHGVARGCAHLLHVTLGTGIGGGLILGGEPWAGEHGMAAEFGHLKIVSDETALPCGCGGRGCVEAYASASAVARRAQDIGLDADAAGVYALARQGHRPAAEILTAAGNHLGQALAEAVKLLDIHTISVSGGLTGAWEFLHPAILSGMENGLIPPHRGKVRILRSTLDDQGGLLGAAAFAARLIAQATRPASS